MKEKFTPGNWVALDGNKPWDENEKVINICQEEGATYTRHSSDVCELVVSHDKASVVSANAHLIAAAPNGFELGLLVMELCGQPNGISEQQSDLLYETALSFIKKARGENVN